MIDHPVGEFFSKDCNQGLANGSCAVRRALIFLSLFSTLSLLCLSLWSSVLLAVC